MPHILMVLTSHDRLGESGRRTGVWLEEFAAPYYVFLDAGATVVLASPNGGQPPVDPASELAEATSPATLRLQTDRTGQAALASTRRLRDIQAARFDAVFFPGGHGPLWDLAESELATALIEAMLSAGKPVAAVCHGPAAFRHANTPDGNSVLQGRAVTGFSNSEEAAAGLTTTVPFLLEDMLRKKGGKYSSARNWQPHVVTDGLLVTGQNPASSAAAALALLRCLQPLPVSSR